MKQYLDENYLCKDEKILTRLWFSNVPLIILWVLAVIATIVLIAYGATHDSIDMALIESIIILVLCGIITLIYLSREAIITNKRVIFKIGLLTIRFIELPLNKIQSVKSTQTFWQRIFKYGTIFISNSTFGIIGYPFNGVEDLEKTKMILSEAIHNFTCIMQTKNDSTDKD